MRERRTQTRIPINCTALVREAQRCVREGQGKTRTCRTVNISVAGVELRARGPFEVGSTLEVEIHLTHKCAVFNHVGRVLWSREDAPRRHVFGVLFISTERNVLVAWQKRIAGLSDL